MAEVTRVNPAAIQTSTVEYFIGRDNVNMLMFELDFGAAVNAKTGPVSTIAKAIEAIANGEMIVVVDDDDRENEGDLIIAASRATPEKTGFIIRHTSGILCVSVPQEYARRLHLDPMVSDNDAPLGTAFTISIDLKEGLTTGISALERANTIRAMADNNTKPTDL